MVLLLLKFHYRFCAAVINNRDIAAVKDGEPRGFLNQFIVRRIFRGGDQPLFVSFQNSLPTDSQGIAASSDLPTSEPVPCTIRAGLRGTASLMAATVAEQRCEGKSGGD